MDPDPASCILLIMAIDVSIVFSFALLFLLLLCSTLISGAEVALFSLNRNEVEAGLEQNSKRVEILSKLLERPKKLLATILVANNFINIAIVVISTFIVDNLLSFGASEGLFQFLITVVSVTLLILLVGEVIPKVYATKHALVLAKTMSLPITFLKKIFKPISSLLIYSTGIIDRKVKRKGLAISVEELSEALDLTEDIPENKDEHRILKGIVKFGETSVKQVMKSRVDVVALENNTPFKEVLNTILDCGHSRIPIFEESFDQIIGILYIKDLLPHLQDTENFEWIKLIRTPFFVPENKKLDDLLKEFQELKTHLAIVVDEYGGSSGIITLEDVLEEIVGEISDEFDTDEIVYSKINHDTYIFEGKIGLNDLFKIIELEDESIFDDVRNEADSLAGLIIGIAGKIPLKGEKINHANFSFFIEAANKRRIIRVRVTINKPLIEDES